MTVVPGAVEHLRVAGVGPVSAITGSAPLVAAATMARPRESGPATLAGGRGTDHHQRGTVDDPRAVAAGVRG